MDLNENLCILNIHAQSFSSYQLTLQCTLKKRVILVYADLLLDSLTTVRTSHKVTWLTIGVFEIFYRQIQAASSRCRHSFGYKRES